MPRLLQMITWEWNSCGKPASKLHHLCCRRNKCNRLRRLIINKHLKMRNAVFMLRLTIKRKTRLVILSKTSFRVTSWDKNYCVISRESEKISQSSILRLALIPLSYQGSLKPRQGNQEILGPIMAVYPGLKSLSLRVKGLTGVKIAKMRSMTRKI